MTDEIKKLLSDSTKEDLIRIIEILTANSIIETKTSNYWHLMADIFHQYVPEDAESSINAEMDMEINKNEAKYVVDESDCLETFGGDQDVYCINIIDQLLKNDWYADVNEIFRTPIL